MGNGLSLLLYPRRPWSQKRMSSKETPAAHGEEAANTGFSSPGVWQLVLRINAIYEARRGKKRVKRLSQSTESNSGKGRTPRHHQLPPQCEKRLPVVLVWLTKQETKSVLCKYLLLPCSSEELGRSSAWWCILWSCFTVCPSSQPSAGSSELTLGAAAFASGT